MTEETAQLFDAPWKADKFVYYHPSGIGEINIRVLGSQNKLVAGYVTTIETANRITHLPELYDALMHFVVNDCPHAFISNDECRLCPDKKCKTRDAVELLRKVRDGR